jgi:hypothetical protein
VNEMKKDLIDMTAVTDHLGCFGSFDLDDSICRQFCAINLRCAVEKEKNDRFELIQDLVLSDDTYLRTQ